jgi:two-component system, OmpR family, response regulator ResD
LCRRPPREEGATGRMADDKAYERVRVLIVDDDEQIRLTLRLIMEEGDFATLEAASGEAALALLRASAEPLVVLLDVMMPHVDGLDVLRAVEAEAELQRHVYLLVTAGGKTLPLADALRLQRLDVPIVFKPFDIDALLGQVLEMAHRIA